jgi:hypothetical protein
MINRGSVKSHRGHWEAKTAESTLSKVQARGKKEDVWVSVVLKVFAA